MKIFALMMLLLLTGCDQDRSRLMRLSECICKDRGGVKLIRFYGSAGALLKCEDSVIYTEVNDTDYVKGCK